MMAHMMATFDPATSPNLNLNWIILMAPLLLPNNQFWSTPSRTSKLSSMIMNQIYSHWSGITKMNIASVSLFTLMATWNILGLLPFTFTPTTQLALSLSLSLPFWLTPFMHLNVTHPQLGSAHLTPSNLGNLALGIAMSLTELMSLFLRPITLTLRLTINISAGHLMLELMASNLSPSLILITTTGILLFIMLELAVALIQAYVFSMLSLLYSKEG